MVFVYVINVGIGQGRVTDNLKGAPVDYAVFVPDAEVIKMVGPVQ